MNKQKKLMLEMSIFYLLIFVAFGTIVIQEKAGDILIPRVQKKMDQYLSDNYQNILNDIKKNNIEYKDSTFTMKISSKINNNYSFNIYYKKNNLSDSYQQDFVEGKTLLENIQTKLEKQIIEKTNLKVKVNIPNKLNEFTTQVQEQIIKEDNLKNLKIYNIEMEIPISTWNKDEITKEITSKIESLNNQSITPKSYTITITNSNNIIESIQISNLTESFLTNPNQKEIIQDILQDNNSNLLKENKITYQYLN